MKRVLSIILTLAMLMSMMSVPMMVSAQSYPNIDLSSGFASDTSLGSNGSKTSAYGIAGKASTDESLMLTEGNNTWTSWMYYEHNEEIYFENGQPMTGYLVAELNFMAPDSQWLAEYFFGLSGNQARMTADITKTIQIGKWNHLRMVYWADETNCDFKDYANNIPDNLTDKLGAADVYVNGVKIGNTKQLTAVINSKGDAYTAEISRILFEVYTGGQGKAEKHSTYMDDIKVYHTSEYPAAATAVTVASSEKYTVSDSTITLTDGASLTTAEFVAANPGCEAVAFTSASLATEISSDTPLAYGNALVVKSADNVYTYYDIADTSTTMLMKSEGELFNASHIAKLAQTEATGVAGKASDDKSILFTALESHDGNIMIDRPGIYTQSKNYLVLEANINPVEGDVNMGSVSVHTKSHGAVSGAAGADKFTFGEWNKYLMYVDFTGNSPKSYTYINGVKVIDGGSPSTNLLLEKTTLRLCFNGVKGQVFSTYVDDFKLYETNTLPDGAALTARPELAVSGNYTLADSTVKVLSGVTVNDIKTANPELSIRVYKNAKMEEELASSDTMNTGCVMAVENMYKSVAVYDIRVSYGEVELDLRDADTKNFADVANGANKGEVVPGFAGKDASDKVLAVTPSGDTFIPLSNWGSATAKTDTAEATWTKSDYNGYLVIEASIYNIDNTTVGIVTTQTKAVSGNLADYIPKNQWSRVKVVYNHRTGDNNYGKAITYVDGTAVTNWINTDLGKVTAYTNTQYCNALRFSLKGSTSGNVATYIDDVRVYETLQVRPVENIEFDAVENSVFTKNAIGVVEGASVTVAAVKASNAAANIKVFNNKTDYTELSDDAVLAAGNVVVAMARSTGAAESNLNINDIIQVMDVETISSTKDLALTPNRVGTSDVPDGVFGNKSATIKKYTNNAAENNWYLSHDSKGASAGMKYIVFETDFAPSAETSSIYLGANQHSNLSASLEVGKQLQAERWHKIVVVFDIEADTSDTYVNGELVSEDFKGCYKTKFEANNNSIQLRVIANANEKIAFDSYFDNFRFYEAINYPVIGESAELTDGYNEAVYGFVDNVSDTISVKAGSKADIEIPGADVVVTDGNFEDVFSDEELASDDMVIIKKNGNFATYTVQLLGSDDIVVIGETYDASTDVMTPGVISVYGVPSSDAMVVVAQYDVQGNIIKIDGNDAADDAGIIPVEFEPEDIDDTIVKAFMVDPAAIKPLCKNKKISHTRNYNLLMLGNSFSMDVTCYMEEIAAAMGKNINIGVLNKGGSAVAYHYTNREINLASSDIMFWLNDKTQGYSNLKTILEKYDWDYVVFQNWGSSKSFYTNSDANYASNWKPMVDLAKYVHELEPAAKLMIHETWSFEAGYNDFKDIATRDAIGADIRALYSRCAEECAAAIGQSEPLAKISSLDAFEAARLYTDAQNVAKFETTYFVNGHKFIDYPNRSTVPVGDGTMLLNEEDAAAGKVSLHRDGFHASQAGRYLIALNAVKFLTGKSIMGNTYRPGEIALDSSAYYGGNEVTDLDNAQSGVIYQKYDPLAEDVVTTLQTIVTNMK